MGHKKKLPKELFCLPTADGSEVNRGGRRRGRAATTTTTTAAAAGAAAAGAAAALAAATTAAALAAALLLAGLLALAGTTPPTGDLFHFFESQNTHAELLVTKKTVTGYRSELRTDIRCVLLRCELVTACNLL